ncbi:exodeoxyribonuclease VII small subunit [Saccharospirillum sp. MSK14-1]|uniref:exodeoxyribonuclease VII small subunit n=1 Tax=Saccharospirillum sp. MSK14-1 TaxID=1897632 RepID=UPI000D35C73A|nr:exodeoxyribonuclease VII small subunit [Saccharospirillum sp. MSK14-1]PTY38992.1 exodeoxyribonuclease VII small subunit [Saccharospirillum sp. MSK14-1]
MSDTQQADFESQMQALEQLVERLESGELSLDDAMKTFEQGIKLTRDCQSALDQAEQKVQVLLGDEGVERLEPLSDED